MTNPIEVTINPLAEIIAKKLSGISGVPYLEQIRMIERTAKSAVEYHEKENAALQAENERLERHNELLRTVPDERRNSVTGSIRERIACECGVWVLVDWEDDGPSICKNCGRQYLASVEIIIYSAKK